MELIELSDFSEYKFVESSNADDVETDELVDLLSSSILFKMESFDEPGVMLVCVWFVLTACRTSLMMLLLLFLALLWISFSSTISFRFSWQLLIFVMHFVLLENDCSGIVTWMDARVKERMEINENGC